MSISPKGSPSTVRPAPFSGTGPSWAVDLSQGLTDATLAAAAQKHAARAQALVEVWGESSPNTQDWNALQAANQRLTDAALTGHPEAIARAVAEGGNPLLMVAYPLPQADGSRPVVSLPVGVVALLCAQEEIQALGPNATPALKRAIQHGFEAVARPLLIAASGQPVVALGTHPDGGMGLSFVAPGQSIDTDSDGFGGLAMVRRTYPLSMAASVALGKVPELHVEHALAPSTLGLLQGEELSARTHANHPTRPSVLNFVQGNEFEFHAKEGLAAYRRQRTTGRTALDEVAADLASKPAKPR